MTTLDLDITLALRDHHRRFDLAIRLNTDASIVALYGPSGGGKSTILKAVAGLLTPASGHIAVGGEMLFDARTNTNLPANARSVGYMFQNYALFPHLSVRDNIGFGLTSWRQGLGDDDARLVDRLIGSFGLQDMSDSRPRQLSGGQQQRVALARALASRPRILLLDEPFAALHPALRAQMRDELRRVQHEWKIPILLITHDIDDVLALAETAFLIEGGQVRREVDLQTGEAVNHLAALVTPMGSASDSPISATRGFRPDIDEVKIRTLLATMAHV